MQSPEMVRDTDPRVAEWASVVDEQIAALLQTLGLEVLEQVAGARQLEGDFQVASLGFTSDVISGYVMLVVEPSAAEASLAHQGVPQDRWCTGDCVAEGSNLLAGKLKAALLRYGIRAMIATPSVMSVRNVLMPTISNRFSSQRLIRTSAGRLAITVEVSPVDDFQLQEDAAAVELSEGISLFL
jgi:hypothetical protein